MFIYIYIWYISIIDHPEGVQMAVKKCNILSIFFASNTLKKASNMIAQHSKGNRNLNRKQPTLRGFSRAFFEIN